MESQIGWLWGALGIFISACIGGYFHLSKRLNELSDHIDMGKNFTEAFKNLATDVHDIKKALMGDIGKPSGLIHKVNEIERDVKTLKET